MQANNQATIAAIATGTSAGGIGVVRVSGPLSSSIAKRLLGHCPKPRYAAFLPFYNLNQQLIDQGIAIFYQGPHSYTGEDVLELQAHGGLVVLNRLLSSCLDAGATQAQPGEFTYRAFMNDKLDLAQAESVADLINATTEEAAKSAVRSLAGEFSKTISSFLESLTQLRVYVEASLDFPEEEIDFISSGNVLEKLQALETRLSTIFNSAKQGVLLRDGFQVVLIGQPNVGKSSLMNALSGEDLAIVTEIAGTTRDTIKSHIQINGVPLHVVDTAGLRETQDTVEKFGIDRTWQAAQSSDIALLLVDSAHGIGDEEKTILSRLKPEIHKIWVHNKIDLSKTKPYSEKIDNELHLFLSAKTGEGLDLLKQSLLDLAGYQTFEEGVFTARARHLEALAEVKTHLHNAIHSIQFGELVAEELTQAQKSLSRITGEFDSDDLLGEIFGKFCIGK